jgi:hypothetical protein
MSKRRLSAPDKETISHRAQGCCEYCKCPAAYSPDSFSIEHIIPRARGGDESMSNLALACQGCNNRKFTRVESEDPVNGERAPLFHPRRDHWIDHFAWNTDATLMIGLTPTGRATIECLRLNRPGVVNLRRILISAGLHSSVNTSDNLPS